MPRYFHRPTGQVIKNTSRPAGSWEEMPPLRDIYRTIKPGRGGWWWQRFRWDEQSYRHTKGWERVLPENQPLPEEWHIGPRSQIRFGFTPLSRNEQKLFKPEELAVAVVLPDLPGLASGANCPGSRHAFPCGMLEQRATATYVIEKLMHYGTSKFSMAANDAAWAILDGGDKKLDEWTRDACDRLHCLADVSCPMIWETRPAGNLVQGWIVQDSPRGRF